jgi:rSAM/selenodomain-associated transferase 2
VRLSVVIPALNEEGSLGATLAALPEGIEVIVVDGGSTDETVRVATSRGVRVIGSERGRGLQMAAGARSSAGDAIWFLHADSIPRCDAADGILRALADPQVAAGNFALRFDGKSFGARFLNRIYPLLALIGLQYGDSGIFVRRTAYEKAGGFAAFPIFEDLDLLRKLKTHGRFVTLSCVLITSSRRFEGRNFAFTFGRWCVMQLLYWAGVNPCRIARMYETIRVPRTREF